jgi:hypothetical protein
MSSTKMHPRASAPQGADGNASKQILLWPATG